MTRETFRAWSISYSVREVNTSVIHRQSCFLGKLVVALGNVPFDRMTNAEQIAGFCLILTRSRLRHRRTLQQRVTLLRHNVIYLNRS